MSLAPSVRSHGDQRQRAPFAHASSSADLTAARLNSPLRSIQHQPSPPWLDADPKPAYLLDSGLRSRSPTPNPFQLPRLTVPGLDTVRFISLCTLWYLSSAVSSNTGKVILNHFKFPVTLTIVQFFFVAFYCIICHQAAWTRLRSPTRAILHGVLPMAAFQVGGHIFGSLAISRVPVSTVHTIKALSPLFTVLAYAALFKVAYSPATYLSLLPLTFGVMLACSFDISISNIFGLICAFGSTLIFVSQNIFFKKIMPTNSDTTGLGAKLDKINLLFFSSSMAFALMVPVWIYSDITRLYAVQLAPDSPSILFYFVLNGTVHFAQNYLAFAILSSTSPVTYSIASLVKRIAVICLAIIWFKQAVHPVQAVGIALTAVGLWMYNNAKRDVEKGEKQMRQVEAQRDGLLPISKTEARLYEGKLHGSPKPSYQDYTHASKSSAVRPIVNLHSKPLVHEAPYPSPPASASPSPPAEAFVIPSRQRKPSVSMDGTHFRLPAAAAARTEEPIEITT